MKLSPTHFGGIPVVAALVMTCSAAHAQTSAFTYQGKLSDAGIPANGDYEIQFGLANALSGGSVLSTLSKDPVTVSDGVFTVELDYGPSAFIGFNRWIEISVRPSGSADPFEVLTPRQAVTSAPYAIHAGSVNASSLIGQVTDANLSTTLSVARTFSSPGNVFFGDGSNLTSLNATELSGIIPDAALPTIPTTALGNAWQLGGNAGTNPVDDFVGTTDSQPLEIRVNGTRALRLETVGGGLMNVIGGWNGNATGSAYTTIAGGGSNLGSLTIGGSANGSSILGGEGNAIGDGSDHSTIGGGDGNEIVTNTSGGTIAGGHGNAIGDNNDYATIGGGQFNNISTSSARAVIAGGANNAIGPNGNWAAISGGRDNTIGPNADQSVIGGGALHSIQGTWSVIGGGLDNAIGLFSDQNVIGGGTENVIDGNSTWSAIGGGLRNTITSDADFATIPGGIDNSVSESYGMAAGRRAQSNHQGAFVWADSSDADFASTAANQFLIRAAGGVGIGTDNPGSTLTVNGTVETTTGGVKFPDGTVQTTAATGSSTEQLRLGPGDFVATDSNVQVFNNWWNGCYGTGSVEMIAPVHIPVGARITKMTAYYRDDAPGNLRFEILAKQNGSGSASGLGYVLFTSNTGYSSESISGNSTVASDRHYAIRVLPVSAGWPGNETLSFQNVVIEWDRP